LVTFVVGDILKSKAQVLTNTVNCVGVMGKGLALEFKQNFKGLFEDYQVRCKKGLVKPGHPYLWANEETQVLNFPTKRHWQEDSKLEDIEAGLKYLATHFREMGINTLALPPLGCGNGNLSWPDVKELIMKHLADIPDLEVFVYESQKAAKCFETDSVNTSSNFSDDETTAALPL